MQTYATGSVHKNYIKVRILVARFKTSMEIMHGEIIKQFEGDKPFPSCLLLGMSVNGRYLHVVIASDNINLHIITAYYPSADEWEVDFKTRKGH